MSFDLAEYADKQEQNIKLMLKTPALAPPANLILDILVSREYSEQEINEQELKEKADQKKMHQ